MKNLYVFIALICTQLALAQSSATFKYQGLARDQMMLPVADQQIGMEVSIIQGQFNGPIIYQERHQPRTSPTGLFNCSIGKGEAISGHFLEIDWSAGPYFLRVDLDIAGGGNYSYAGTSLIEAVPFALYAQTAENVDDADADPTNEIQMLSYHAADNSIEISGGNKIILPSSESPDADSDPNNEIQELSRDGNKIQLTNGGSVIDAVDDADADPENELQILSKEGNRIQLSQGGSVIDAVDDADADPTNELQTLSYNRQKSLLKISGGNQIDLSLSDGDGDPSNELQELRTIRSNNELEPLRLQITHGNVVSLPLLTPWDVHKKDGKISALSSSVPVKTDDLIVKNIEVFDVPSHWPYPQITQKEYGFRTGNGRIGLRMAKDRLSYYRKDTGDDILMQLGGKDLRFYDYQKYVIGELGRSGQSGFLKLYPGGSTTPYFRVEKTGSNRVQLLISSAKTKGQIFRVGESNNHWGYSHWSGSNGSHNVTIGAHGNSGSLNNSGAVMVHNASSAAKAGAYVNAAGKGVLFADIKNFRIDHPLDAKKEIVYASLEGPEAAIYERGTATLQNGTAEIKFSDHFALILAKTRMTVQLTPLSAQSKGLAVVEKTQDGFKVKELHHGAGHYQFDWEVKAVRNGYQDFEVVRPKQIHN